MGVREKGKGESPEKENIGSVSKQQVSSVVEFAGVRVMRHVLHKSSKEKPKHSEREGSTVEV